MKKYKLSVLIASFLVVFLAAFIGNLFTSQNVTSAWYESIKPGITPPNYVFPVAWTALFFLIALSLFFSWSNSKAGDKEKVTKVFGINLALNVLWSFFYFGLKNPLLGLINIILILISIISMIIVLWKIDRKASYLLIPYLLWVGFASVLNLLSVLR